MKKSEIKEGIKLIQDSITRARKKAEEYLQPYEEIKKHFEAIEEIQDENGIDCGIDFESASIEILISCIDNNEDIVEISDQFDILINDLEDWCEEVSEEKSETIQEKYIDVLDEIKDDFDTDSIESEDDLDNKLSDMFNALNEIEV